MIWAEDWRVSSGFLRTANLLTIVFSAMALHDTQGGLGGKLFFVFVPGVLFEFSAYKHDSLRISPLTLSFYQNLALFLTPPNTELSNH